MVNFPKRLWRALRPVLLFYLLAFCICFYFADDIFSILDWPYVWVWKPLRLIYSSPPGFLFLQLKLAAFGAAVITLPYAVFRLGREFAGHLFATWQARYLNLGWLPALMVLVGCLFGLAAVALELASLRAANLNILYLHAAGPFDQILIKMLFVAVVAFWVLFPGWFTAEVARAIERYRGA